MLLVRLIFTVFIVLILSACREEIVHNLEENEANRLLSRLLENSFDARKDKQADGKWSLSLPGAESAGAIRFLATQRLLADKPEQITEKAGILSSREEQRFFFERGLSKEIEATLIGLPGVLQARVHLNLPVHDPLFGQSSGHSSGSGSVLLVIENNNKIKMEDVAALVSGASGTPASAISVVITYNNPAEDRQSETLTSESPEADAELIREVNSGLEAGWLLQHAEDSFQGRFIKFSLSLVNYLTASAWIYAIIILAFAMVVATVLRIISRPQKSII